jgi:3-ketosteroid 9alpha-monooxygenase subunit B
VRARLPRALRVAEVVEESADTRSFAFDVPPSDADLLRYEPGQFLTLRIPSERTGSVARCYSLSSAPLIDDRLVVTVKRTPGGYGSNWLCDNVRPGDEVEILPPGGTFVHKNLASDILLVAAGSGVTPIFSILKSVLAHGHGRAFLIYANRDRESIIFAGAIAEFARTHKDRFEVFHWLESERGLPSAGALSEIAAPYAGRDAFICGPAPFMDAATEALLAVGSPSAQIKREIYHSLSGDPFVAEAADPAEDPAARTVPVEVRLDGETYRFAWPENQSLVTALLARDVEAPYSCREGECGACQCLLVSGHVTMANNDVLSPSEVGEGAILGCQAYPDLDGAEPVAVEIDFDA